MYDITHPKFRRIIEKILKDYGVRVQYSVFEFSLEEKIYIKMLKKLKETYKEYKFKKGKNIIKAKKKSIIIYKINLQDIENKICLNRDDYINIIDIDSENIIV